MAKTKKEITRRIKSLAELKCERLKRNPQYQRDYEEYKKETELCIYFCSLSEATTKQKATYKKYIHLKGELLKCQYNIKEIIDPKDSKKHVEDFYSPASPVLPDEFYKILAEAKLKKDNAGEVLKKLISSILKESRWLVLKIDTDKDKEIIRYGVTHWIDLIKKEKKRHVIGKSDRSPQLSKYKRYLAVFELRERKLPYSHIVCYLKKEGWYIGKDTKTAENLARQDCRSARRIIGKMQKVLKSTFGKKPIIGITELRKHPEKFEKFEEILAKEGLGLDEVLTEDGYIKLGYGKDGMTKKKIKGISKTDEEIREAASARLKKEVRKRLEV